MKRRALSTVVGAVFFVIVMASTISYVAYSMDLIDNLARSVDVKQDETLNRQNEKFDILGISITSDNKFNVTLHNSGNLPVKITRLFVENTTDSSWNATKYDIDTVLSPGQTKSNIANNLPIYYADTESYLLNFVTERGNNEKISVNSGGNQAIHTNLFALPNIVPTKFSTVLLYEVVNNSTGQLVNLVPQMNWTKICTDCEDPVLKTNWQPASYQSLKPGQVATFQTSYTLEGDDGDIYFFNASLQNAYPGVWDREKVDIQIVSEAETAGVSITAQGLGATGSDPLSLVLHRELTESPLLKYQLSSTKTDGGNNGLVLNYDVPNEKYSWFTKNGTQTIYISGANDWIAALQYKSKFVPPSITTNPDLIFYFDNDNYPTSILNSQGDADRNLRPGTLVSGDCDDDAPTQVTGAHQTKGYDFDGPNKQCFESVNTVSGGDFNDIDKGNDSTAFWFKTDVNMQASDPDQYFVNFEGNNEYYRVYLTQSGKIAFKYAPKSNESITCTSVKDTYDNSGWHHVVVQRSEPANIATCQMWIDYHKDALNREYIISTAGNFNDFITTDGRWTVGSNKAQNGNFFNGQMDVLMHWDDYLFDATKAADLAKTSYGFDAHRLGFELKRTTHDGTPAGGQPPMNYVTAFFPFQDPQGKPDTDDTAYRNFNFTMNVNDVTLDPMPTGHRLNFTLYLDPTTNSTWRNHSFDLLVDDDTITPFTSFIALPEEPSNPIPGYEAFPATEEFEFNFKNGGDRGFRYTFSGTRLVLNATDGSGSFAAIPCAVDGDCSDGDFQLKSEQDSIHIYPGFEGYIKFYPLRDVPSHSPPKGNPIVAGVYKGAIWVLGYDDEGLPFEKTFDLGIVTIT